MDTDSDLDLEDFDTDSDLDSDSDFEDNPKSKILNENLRGWIDLRVQTMFLAGTLLSLCFRIIPTISISSTPTISSSPVSDAGFSDDAPLRFRNTIRRYQY